MTKQLSRDEALAALAGDRFNAANLRVQIRLAEEQLKELGDFERRWDRFVQSLGSVVEAGQKGRLYFWGPKLADGVRNAEDARLDLVAIQRCSVMHGTRLRSSCAPACESSVAIYGT